MIDTIKCSCGGTIKVANMARSQSTRCSRGCVVEYDSASRKTAKGLGDLERELDKLSRTLKFKM